MSRFVRIVSLSVVVAALWPATAWAQHPSEVVGFNGPPINNPATCQEMFRLPQFSGSTADYILLNTAG